MNDVAKITEAIIAGILEGQKIASDKKITARELFSTATVVLDKLGLADKPLIDWAK